MENKDVLFDDWQTRCEGVLNRRCVEYTVCIIIISILFLASCVGLFFELALITPLVLSIISLAVVVFEWKKVKNSHLIIYCNEIQITDRFNKTTYYKTHIHELTLELIHSFNSRSGGIIMKFYDANGNLVCKYEDMLNRSAPWGFDKTNWEKSINKLGIKIIDRTGILKN